MPTDPLNLRLTVDDYLLHAVISVMAFSSVYLFIRYGWETVMAKVNRMEARFDHVLNHHLLLDIPPRVAVMLTGCAMLVAGLLCYLIGQHVIFFVGGAAAGLALPNAVIAHVQEKRRKKLDEQIVDGVTTLASGVRAGLNLVQSIELLIRNSKEPIKQEFAQMHREYELGMDLQQAMHNASNRIGSSYYRLLFGAIAAHRSRGGNMGESLDRIADSIREIQRLEGRLDALTAQGRAQARFMGVMPIVVVGVLWVIMPQETQKLLTEPVGRVILMVAVAMIAAGFVWIRRIMAVDI